MFKNLFILLALTSCTIDRSMNSLSDEEQATLAGFEGLVNNHIIRIGEENEPGDPLVLCLTFVDKSNNKPLTNQKVHFYHADVNGEYQPSVPGDETTARLSGSAVTDISGKILLKTTLPGDYGSSEDNRHIHTTVFGAKPEAYDIHFKQYTGFMGTRFADGSDQHFLADLKKDENNVLIAFLTIEVKINPDK